MRRTLPAVAVGLALALAAAGCSSSNNSQGAASGSPSSPPSASLPDLSGQTIHVEGVWTGAEQQQFQAVLDKFDAQTHATTVFQSDGANLATVLTTKVKGGDTPDIALVPNPGLVRTFVAQGALKPLGADVTSAVTANYPDVWKQLGVVDGKLYGVWVDASDKSTVWYNTKLFSQAGVRTPATWEDFLKTAQTISDSGVTPVSIDGADGWPLADWFANVYLSQAGPAMYDKLTNHQIPWTDPSVVTALQTIAQLWGNDHLVAGGHAGVLQTDFAKSITQVFGSSPAAAMVYEGDFVALEISTATKSVVGTDAKYFPFPATGATTKFVTGGGDIAVAFKDSPASAALMRYLAGPEAGQIFVRTGGKLSSDKNVPLSAYPDATTRQEAADLIGAGDNFRFGLDDLEPSAFGGTPGKGMWGDMQKLMANPADAQGVAAQLEADAAQVFPK